MIKTITGKSTTLYNYSQIILWAITLVLLISTLITKHILNQNEIQIYDKALTQLYQTTDIFLSLARINKGSPLMSFGQISARILVLFYFITVKIPIEISAIPMICWSLAEIIRFSFYVSRSAIITFLRYNAFIVLYPVGVLIGEVGVINYYINNLLTPENKYLEIYMRVLQGILSTGMLVLMKYVWENRKKYYKNLNKKTN